MSGSTTKWAASRGASAEPPNAQSCPWLMFSHGRSKHIQTFYSIADNRLVKRRLPHLPRTSIIHATRDGWAVVTVEEKDGDSYSCFLLHLTSMERILLPNLKDIEKLECFISSSPLKANCIVIFSSYIVGDNGACGGTRIKLWRPNQEIWAVVSSKETLTDFISTCDGKIYGRYDFYNFFGMVDIHDDDDIHLINQVKLPTDFKGSNTLDQFLIESCGDVFMVHRLLSSLVEYRVRTILVYKLVQDKKTSKMQWIRVTDIGDCVFFIHGNSKISCSASQAGLKGNSIYFIGLGEDDHIYRYSLLENRLYRSLPCPDAVKKITQICWLMIS